MENYDIAQILRMKREALGYSRKKVCELCNHNFSEKTLYRMETGKTDMNRHTIKELLNLYSHASHTVCAAVDMESYTVYRMYNEILALLFQREYKEAERKLELFELYVKENSNAGRKYLLVLKKAIEYFMQSGYAKSDIEFEFFEDTLKQITPVEADISKWPFTDIELNTYLTYFNILFLRKRYDIMEPLIKLFLKNIEQGYLNLEIFTDFYCGFTYRLVDVLHSRGQYDGANEIAKKSLEQSVTYGDMSGFYMLQNCLIRNLEYNNFFNDKTLQNWCFQKVEKMYYLSIACDDTWYRNFLKKRLIEVYKFRELY